MVIFKELRRYEKRIEEKNKNRNWSNRDYFARQELSEEEKSRYVERQSNISVPKKSTAIQLLWQNMLYTVGCMGQVAFVLTSIVLIVLVGSYLTKGCSSYTDTDHVHFERYK